MSTRLVPALIAAATCGALYAQAPAFEVASVKRNTSVDSRQNARFLPGGRIEVTNMPLRTLIRVAYGSTGSQIVGGPGWIASDGYDIVAKVAGPELDVSNGPPPQMLTMLRSLLEERFKLVVHRETRETQTYALVLATRDGKPGPALKASNGECDASRTCGIRGGNGDVTYTGLAIPQIATSIAGFPAVRTAVADRTGLTGRYDLHLVYGSEPSDTAPSLFTALVEQAGLKLQPEKGAVEFIVIDRAERPEEN
jgi:uncharacterized protein (TIGR03435 family)